MPGTLRSVYTPRDLEEVREREFFIDNLLVRIHFIIVMIRWAGLAPWDFVHAAGPRGGLLSSSLLLSSLTLSDTQSL